MLPSRKITVFFFLLLFLSFSFSIEWKISGTINQQSNFSYNAKELSDKSILISLPEDAVSREFIVQLKSVQKNSHVIGKKNTGDRYLLLGDGCPGFVEKQRGADAFSSSAFLGLDNITIGAYVESGDCYARGCLTIDGKSFGCQYQGQGRGWVYETHAENYIDFIEGRHEFGFAKSSGNGVLYIGYSSTYPFPNGNDAIQTCNWRWDDFGCTSSSGYTLGFSNDYYGDLAIYLEFFYGKPKDVSLKLNGNQVCAYSGVLNQEICSFSSSASQNEIKFSSSSAGIINSSISANFYKTENKEYSFTYHDTNSIYRTSFSFSDSRYNKVEITAPSEAIETCLSRTNYGENCLSIPYSNAEAGNYFLEYKTKNYDVSLLLADYASADEVINLQNSVSLEGNPKNNVLCTSNLYSKDNSLLSSSSCTTSGGECSVSLSLGSESGDYRIESSCSDSIHIGKKEKKITVVNPSSLSSKIQYDIPSIKAGESKNLFFNSYIELNNLLGSNSWQKTYSCTENGKLCEDSNGINCNVNTLSVSQNQVDKDWCSYEYQNLLTASFCVPEYYNDCIAGENGKCYETCRVDVVNLAPESASWILESPCTNSAEGPYTPISCESSSFSGFSSTAVFSWYETGRVSKSESSWIQNLSRENNETYQEFYKEIIDSNSENIPLYVDTEINAGENLTCIVCSWIDDLIPAKSKKIYNAQASGNFIEKKVSNLSQDKEKTSTLENQFQKKYVILNLKPNPYFSKLFNIKWTEGNTTGISNTGDTNYLYFNSDFLQENLSLKNQQEIIISENQTKNLSYIYEFNVSKKNDFNWENILIHLDFKEKADEIICSNDSAKSSSLVQFYRNFSNSDNFEICSWNCTDSVSLSSPEFIQNFSFENNISTQFITKKNILKNNCPRKAEITLNLSGNLSRVEIEKNSSKEFSSLISGNWIEEKRVSANNSEFIFYNYTFSNNSFPLYNITAWVDINNTQIISNLSILVNNQILDFNLTEIPDKLYFTIPHFSDFNISMSGRYNNPPDISIPLIEVYNLSKDTLINLSFNITDENDISSCFTNTSKGSLNNNTCIIELDKNLSQTVFIYANDSFNALSEKKISFNIIDNDFEQDLLFNKLDFQKIIDNDSIENKGETSFYYKVEHKSLDFSNTSENISFSGLLTPNSKVQLETVHIGSWLELELISLSLLNKIIFIYDKNISFDYNIIMNIFNLAPIPLIIEDDNLSFSFSPITETNLSINFTESFEFIQSINETEILFDYHSYPLINETDIFIYYFQIKTLLFILIMNP